MNCLCGHFESCKHCRPKGPDGRPVALDQEAFQDLADWAARDSNRHFVVCKRGSCNETRWRVAVWEKPEGQAMTRIPGHGAALTLDDAVTEALKNFSAQQWPDRLREQGFYSPKNLWPLIPDAGT